MTKFAVKPLGQVLQQAGLVSAAQIETALEEQAQSRHLRLGEILALHGWIKLETADFFALEWPASLKRPRQPLGKYFKRAALLDEAQIQIILSEQKQTRQKLGEIAVAKGWITENTRNFFVEFQASLPKQDLTPERLFDSWRSSPNFHSLRPIRDRLLNNQQCNPFWLLELYRQILQQGSIAADHSPEQQELISSGLVVQQQRRLKIAKPLYVSVFDLGWVEREQNRLQPYRRVKPKLEEKVESPYKVLEEILLWTNRQPWLAQKLCQLVCQSQHFIVAGEEAQRVEQLVQTAIVNDWQHGAAAEHLLTIRDRLVQNPVCSPASLLRQYFQIWQQGLPADGSLEQAELLGLGLIDEQQNTLKVANPIYRSVFNQNWVTQEMTNLLPGSEAPSIADASRQQTVTVAAQTLKKDSKGGKTVWGLICAAVAGSAVIGFYFWQRPSIVSTPNSTTESTQPAPEAAPESPVASEPSPVVPAPEPNLEPTQPAPEAAPESPVASEPSPVDVPAPEPIPAASSPSINVPTFTVGTTEAELRQTLGEPDWKRQGYWSNSRAWLYKDLVPNQVDLGYLFDTNTQKLRQTEVSFAQSTDLETIQETLTGLLQGNSTSAQAGLMQIYRREIKQHSFQVGTLEGIIQRHENDRIYIGVWDADFH